MYGLEEANKEANIDIRANGTYAGGADASQVAEAGIF